MSTNHPDGTFSGSPRACETYDLTYLLLRAGVQSSCLMAMSALGLSDCPRANVAIFSDTGDEPAWLYEHLAWLEQFGQRHGLPVRRVQHGHLSQDVIARHNWTKSRFAAIPAFTRGWHGAATPLRRQCTREYKIEPIDREVRRMLGLRPDKGQQESTKYGACWESPWTNSCASATVGPVGSRTLTH